MYNPIEEEKKRQCEKEAAVARIKNWLGQREEDHPDDVVTFEYTGYGDSYDGVSTYGSEDLPDWLNDAVDKLVPQDGWWNDAGGGGTITLSSKEQTIVVNHYDYYTETTNRDEIVY